MQFLYLKWDLYVYIMMTINTPFWPKKHIRFFVYERFVKLLKVCKIIKKFWEKNYYPMTIYFKGWVSKTLSFLPPLFSEKHTFDPIQAINKEITKRKHNRLNAVQSVSKRSLCVLYIHFVHGPMCGIQCTKKKNELWARTKLARLFFLLFARNSFRIYYCCCVCMHEFVCLYLFFFGVWIAAENKVI